MTYANYGGFSYMGIERPALVRAFKDLRGQGFAARLGLSNDESYSMRYNVSPGQYGAVWTEASNENMTWRQGTGDWQAQFGTYVPLEISVSGGLTGRGMDEWTAFRNAGYVCRVLEIHGLHPFVDLDAYVTSPELLQEVCIRLYPSTRLYEMTMADTEVQERRTARLRHLQASEVARDAQHHEDRILDYIDRYAKALCDQGVLRSHEGTDVVERLEIRQQSIDALLIELSHSSAGVTPEELARIVTDGANTADERLRAMHNDVIDGGIYGNARAAEFLRLGSTATMAFPWLT